jgi:hypothetical protein
MVRLSALLVFAGVTAFSSLGGAENQVRWTVHTGPDAAGVSVALPAALFKDVTIPMRGTRWRCLADKVLRQDTGGNTFSTLTIRCSDGETTVSSAASCAIGSHENAKLSFELVETTSHLTNAVRAECDG